MARVFYDDAEVGRVEAELEEVQEAYQESLALLREVTPLLRELTAKRLGGTHGDYIPPGPAKPIEDILYRIKDILSEWPAH